MKCLFRFNGADESAPKVHFRAVKQKAETPENQGFQRSGLRELPCCCRNWNQGFWLKTLSREKRLSGSAPEGREVYCIFTTR